MKILLDLQACQTPGSKNRGIGRYTLELAKEIAVQSSGIHDVHILLNGGLMDPEYDVRDDFVDILHADKFHVFGVVSPCRRDSEGLDFNYEISKISRQAIIDKIAPDVVHVGSLFEGFHEDAVTDIPYGKYLTSVTLYDLIPYILKDIYLRSDSMKAWYFSKIKELSRADIVLSISESSRQEAIQHLGYDGENVINISCAIDKNFAKADIEEINPSGVLSTYGLNASRYIMYTGGIDYRKNIEGLIEAYSLLPVDVKEKYKLAIVCSISVDARQKLDRVVKKFGLEYDNIVFTNFVSSSHLVTLYKGAALFVFPSLHEGFGLPVLEAMTCGVPTIGANNSSIPEVLGNHMATFDAASPLAIRDAIIRVLTDRKFQRSLHNHAQKQITEFSWENTARKALAAMDAAYAKRIQGGTMLPHNVRPRLALVTPVTPLQSGIADYAVELIPELVKVYDVDVITDQKNIKSDWVSINCVVRSIKDFEREDDLRPYDRIVYQFGNSEFHAHMIELLKVRPGVVVLHDYYLSGMKYWRSVNGYEGNFINECIDSDGYIACKEISDYGPSHGIVNFKANRDVVENAAGIIVHSQANIDAISHDYGIFGTNLIKKVDQIRAYAKENRKEAREKLGYTDNDIVIVSLGIIAPTKLYEEIIQAFSLSKNTNSTHCKLILVGRAPGDYGERIQSLIDRYDGSGSISISGFVDSETYVAYLCAADIAIQLRTQSRGETSRAVLDCMAYGVPTIVNRHGTFAELDVSSVVMVDDPVLPEDLKNALDWMISDKKARQEIGASALANVRKFNSPHIVGQAYCDAIEGFLSHPSHSLKAAIKSLGRTHHTIAPTNHQMKLAALRLDDAFWWGGRDAMIDIGALCSATPGLDTDHLREWIQNLILSAGRDGVRLQPVYFDQADEQVVLREAGNWMRALHGLQLKSADPIVNRVAGAQLLLIDSEVPYKALVNANDRSKFLIQNDLRCVALSIRCNFPSSLNSGSFEQYASMDDFAQIVIGGGAKFILSSVANRNSWIDVIRNANVYGRDKKIRIITQNSNSLSLSFSVQYYVLGMNADGFKRMFDGVNSERINQNIKIIVFNDFEFIEIKNLITDYLLNNNVFIEKFGSYADLRKMITNKCVLIIDDLSENGIALILSQLTRDSIVAIRDHSLDSYCIEAKSLVYDSNETIIDVFESIDFSQAQNQFAGFDFKKLQSAVNIDNEWSESQVNIPARRYTYRSGLGKFWHTVGEQFGNFVQTDGRSGYILIGPYAPFRSGVYMMNIMGADVGIVSNDFSVTIACDAGQKVIRTLTYKDINRSSGSCLFEAVSFKLPVSVQDLEIKIYVNESDRCIVSDIEIWPVN